MNDLDLEDILSAWAKLATASGVLLTLLESGALKEDKGISKETFPKGGISLLKKQMNDAYQLLDTVISKNGKEN